MTEVTNTLKKTANNIKETASNVDMSEVKGKVAVMTGKAALAVERLRQESKETGVDVKEVLKANEETKEVLKVCEDDALKIIYLVMTADGEVSADEEDKFDSIAEDMQVSGDAKYAVVKYCKRLVYESDQEDYEDYIRDGVVETLKKSLQSKKGTIDPKLLLWNLLVVGYSDGDYSEAEKRIIRYVARTLKIDRSVVPEMEGSIHALLAIEKEADMLKNSDRKYSVIESELNELDDRRKTIMQGVYDLIRD